MKIHFYNYFNKSSSFGFNSKSIQRIVSFIYTNTCFSIFKYTIKKLSIQFPKIYKIYSHYFAPPTNVEKAQNKAPSQRQATQTDIETLIEAVFSAKDKKKPIVFAKLLSYCGLSSDIHNINFEITSLTVHPPCLGTGKTPIHSLDTLNHIDFSGVNFNNCNFNHCDLSNSTFQNGHFKDCSFKSALFEKSKMMNVHFEKCYIEHSSFSLSHLENVLFNNVNMPYTCFHRADMNHVQFLDLDLLGVSFLKSKIENVKIVSCQTENALLFDNENHVIFEDSAKPKVTKPVVLLLWENKAPGLTASKIVRSLIGENTIPIKYDYKLEGIINEEQLDVEANKKSLSHENSTLPITQHLIAFDESFPQINSLRKQIKELTSFVHGICLPGGSDLKPELYGQTAEEWTTPETTYTRTILEASLIAESNSQGVPLFGICRGAQVGNVFYGGDIIQHVEGHKFKVQNYKIKQAEGITHGILKDSTLTALSAHHQAIGKIGAGLKETIRYKNVPKALEKISGAPQLFLQFHPEFQNDKTSITGHLINVILSGKNQTFWQVLADAAKTFQCKKLINESIRN